MAERRDYQFETHVQFSIDNPDRPDLDGKVFTAIGRGDTPEEATTNADLDMQRIMAHPWGSGGG